MTLTQQLDLYLVSGQKGGSGKSTMTRGVAEYCYANNIDYLGVDADKGNADFYRYYPKTTIIQNLDTEDDYFRFTTTIEQRKSDGKSGPVLISMPARASESSVSNHELMGAMREELDVQMTLFWVINRDMDGIHQLKFALDNFGYLYNRVIVVQNGFFGGPDDFQAWRESKTRTRVLDDGGAEIYVPKLNSGLTSKILALRQEDRIHGFSLREIIDLQLVGLGERAAVKKWLSSTFSELDRVF